MGKIIWSSWAGITKLCKKDEQWLPLEELTMGVKNYKDCLGSNHLYLLQMSIVQSSSPILYYLKREPLGSIWAMTIRHLWIGLVSRSFSLLSHGRYNDKMVVVCNSEKVPFLEFNPVATLIFGFQLPKLRAVNVCCLSLLVYEKQL